MKTSTVFLCGGLALALVGSAAAMPPVNVYGKAYYNDKVLVLNVLADSVVQLRSFGIRLDFDPASVVLETVSGNDPLWFFSAQPGLRSVYTPSQIAQNSVRIVGARFQGDQRAHGVTGNNLLLATLMFKRVNSVLPSFQLALAGPVNYASFVTIDGIHIDQDVEGLGTLVLDSYALSDDSDGDGIPDQVELGWFGNLTRANATSDNDGDGVRDIDEWIAGTNAADPQSATRLVLSIQPNNNRLISWIGQPGRVYDLMWSGDLTTFVPIAEGLTPEVPNSFFDNTPADKRFYRLRIHMASVGP